MHMFNDSQVNWRMPDITASWSENGLVINMLRDSWVGHQSTMTTGSDHVVNECIMHLWSVDWTQNSPLAFPCANHLGYLRPTTSLFHWYILKCGSKVNFIYNIIFIQIHPEETHLIRVLKSTEHPTYINVYELSWLLSIRFRIMIHDTWYSMLQQLVMCRLLFGTYFSLRRLILTPLNRVLFSCDSAKSVSAHRKSRLF